MRLKNIEINGFKSFAKKTNLEFNSPVVSIVGPNGSGKSNVVEAIRFVLGEQSIKSMRGKAGLDLIFKGSKSLSRGSRASVSIFFDNSDKIFKLSNDTGDNINLNYDTISISREVHSDGLNKYILNGIEVRLKDIHNLLASVNIGSSSHHIISQGEADRILNASSKERKEMIEDALGLKIYQYKIKEAERKLERTQENMKEVASLRREIAPHLNFLRRQVDKFEKAKEMKIELLSLYKEYLKKESIYLERENSFLVKEKENIANEISVMLPKLSSEDNTSSEENNKDSINLQNLEQKIYEINRLKGELERKLGRIEGIIEIEEKRQPKSIESENISIPREELASLLQQTNEYLENATEAGSIEYVFPILEKIKNLLGNLYKHLENDHTSEKDPQSNDTLLKELSTTHSEILSQISKIDAEGQKISSEINLLKNKISEDIISKREEQKERFNLKVKHQELTANLRLLEVKKENLDREREVFENEIKEGNAIIGNEIFSYKDFSVEEDVDRSFQDERRRKIERIKIKLEDAGLGGGSEVVKEFEDVSQRDQFLAKEMEDLSLSIISINELLVDLKEKINSEFKNGIEKINKEFQDFFALMFGGGTGALHLIVENKRRKKEDDMIEEEIGFEQGIEISVSLPHKKVKELHALSGGERSLTSIALLFAMSQVNPPPFLVLDETDAALDEANSRKYGDMLEKLSMHSQLIVVTHNRETMSRAQILYGVTVGSDGASKLLSVKFEEAAAIAK